MGAMDFPPYILLIRDTIMKYRWNRITLTIIGTKSKATVIDKISSKVFKIASPVIAGSLAYIFN